MNPPFEKLADTDHVQYVYKLLKPGGKLIAIIGESPFFNSQRKAVKFREWLDSVNGRSEKLPRGTFKASARMVCIEKSEA